VARREQWIHDTAAGKRLAERLLSHPSFKPEQEMAKRAVELLVSIASRNSSSKKGGDYGIPYKDIHNRFRDGLLTAKTYMTALKALGLLELSLAPIPQTRFNPGRVSHFRVHQSVIDAYHDARMDERLNLGFEGKLCKGAKARRRSRRRKEATSIKDPFCRVHEQLCCSVEVDWDWDEKFMKEKKEKMKTAVGILGQLTWVDFDPIKNDGRQSRLYHPLANFPKEVRKHLKVGRLRYRGEVDIRACWPTFLSAQLLKLNPDASEALKAECDSWQKAFCKPGKENDPRKAILKETGLKIDQKELKTRLNEYLSGYLQSSEQKGWKPPLKHKAIDEWFIKNHPLMHKAWKVAGPKKLAYQIGLNFETPIMADKQLYDYADKHGIMLYYQYDGFGVFALPGKQKTFEAALAGLRKLMHDISKEKFGVPIVVQ
jgi:hypothetical protein